MTDRPEGQQHGSALDLFRLDGRNAVVTGASSGLGARLSQTLLGAGASVVMAARRADRLEAQAGEHDRAHVIPCDVGSSESCETLYAGAMERLGHIDILINAAGVSRPAPCAEETPEMFQSVVNVNLLGTYRLSRLFGTHMVERGGGSIVNIASIVGLVGLGRMPQASYAASKAGVVNLTRELAAQWARRGVRVNAIAPGFFATEMTDELFATDMGRDWVAKLTPMGRGGSPHELDGAALFLASAASSYVTGAVLPVDGGWTAV